jgi:predicted homoserine dehydrogenase-like protein
MKAGEMLDGEGGFTVWGKAQPLESARGALPIGLAHGVPLLRDVQAGETLHLQDVGFAEGDRVAALYRTLAAG